MWSLSCVCKDQSHPANLSMFSHMIKTSSANCGTCYMCVQTSKSASLSTVLYSVSSSPGSDIACLFLKRSSNRACHVKSRTLVCAQTKQRAFTHAYKLRLCAYVTAKRWRNGVKLILEYVLWNQPMQRFMWS